MSNLRSLMYAATIYILNKKNGDCLERKAFNEVDEMFAYLNDKDAFNSSNPNKFEIIFNQDRAHFNSKMPWLSDNVSVDFVA